MKHTPTPWEIKFFPVEYEDTPPEFFIRSASIYLPNGFPRPEIMADDAQEGNGYPYEQKLADANLIVKAVNTYKELEEKSKLFDQLLDVVIEYDKDLNGQRAQRKLHEAGINWHDSIKTLIKTIQNGKR